MAFEAVLEHAQGLGSRRPRAWRRAMLTVSLTLHGIAVAVGLAYSLWQVDELPLPQVAVTLAAGAPPPPPPPPAAHKKSSSTKPKVKPTPRPEVIVQPQEKPQPKPKDEPQDEPGAQEGGVKGGVAGGVVGASLVETGPQTLPPQVAKEMLLIDPNDDRYRVQLPPALERAGVSLFAIVRLCANNQGAVTEVRVLKGAGPAIDPQIPTVLRRWRYRPLLLNGRPTPFCTMLRYEVTAR